jgi:hypothetical protein
MTGMHTARETKLNSLPRRHLVGRQVLAIAGLLLTFFGCGSGGSPPVGSTSLNTAVLAWDPVMDPNLGGYRVYYGTAPGMYQQPSGEGVPVAAGVTTHILTGLSSGTTYYFAVTDYDTMGNESGYSNEAFKNIP